MKYLCLEGHQQGPGLRLEQVVQTGLPSVSHDPASAMCLPTKSLGPGWSPALRWSVCMRRLWAHCCSSLLLRWCSGATCWMQLQK